MLGFLIDPQTGRWTGDQENPDASPDDGPDAAQSERIVPIVEDHKNALLIRFDDLALEVPVVATVQHALARGIERVFQLEEGEVMSEPLPDRERRTALLYYEASEGGAGVLSRFIAEPQRLHEVARVALTAMHYHWNGIPIADVAAGDLARLTLEMLEDPGAHCVKGCYRCLLSYYNQLDHEQIDRTLPAVLTILLRLSRCTVAEQRQSPTAGSQAGTEPVASAAWRAAILAWGLPAPDEKPLVVGGTTLPLVWRGHYVAAAVAQPAPTVVAVASERGFSLVEIPEQPDNSPPPQLSELLGGCTDG